MHGTGGRNPSYHVTISLNMRRSIVGPFYVYNFLCIKVALRVLFVFTRTLLWYVVCANKSLWKTMSHLSYKLNGPLARYAKLWVAHAPGMPGTFSPTSLNSDPDMHHGTCVTHVPWCMPGSLTSGFLWSRWQGKRSRHSRRMRNLQFNASRTRPMPWFFR